MISKPLSGSIIDLFHPLSRGLIGAWLFNEKTGSKSYDQSNKNNHGVLTNNPLWVGSEQGGCLDFHGTSYINVSEGNGIFDLTSEISIISLVKFTTDGGSGSFPTIMSKNYLSGWAGMFLGTTRRPRSYIVVGGTPYWRAGNIVCPLDEWSHVAYVYGKGYQRTYVNGVLDLNVAQSGDIDTNNTDVLIGAGSGPSLYFPGLIDSIYLYNRTLLPVEIKQLAHNPYSILL